jgi:hypothetical protein
VEDPPPPHPEHHTVADGYGVGYAVGDGVWYTMPPKQPSDEML